MRDSEKVELNPNSPPTPTCSTGLIRTLLADISGVTVLVVWALRPGRKNRDPAECKADSITAATAVVGVVLAAIAVRSVEKAPERTQIRARGRRARLILVAGLATNTVGSLAALVSARRRGSGGFRPAIMLLVLGDMLSICYLAILARLAV